jgi:hypothetical protein
MAAGNLIIGRAWKAGRDVDKNGGAGASFPMKIRRRAHDIEEDYGGRR